jgi:hypothetical protein
MRKFAFLNLLILQMKIFERWTFEQVEETFDIKRVKKLEALENWLKAEYQPNTEQKKRIEHLKTRLQENAEIWNEDELKFYFLGLLVDLVEFDQEDYKFKSFLQRKLSGYIGDMALSGVVDFMVAKGKQEPKHPFFFLHEYKQERKRENDPLGQLLIAMVVAQNENNNDAPILGAYVTGRLWFFVILEGKKYSVSMAYDATQEDIFQIFAILQQAKALILAQVSKK